MELIWEAPPEPTHGNKAEPRYAAILATLKDRPGEWARLANTGVKNPQSLVTDIRKGRLKGIAEGEYDATSRTIDGEHHLYVCYIGPEVQ